MKHNQDQLRLDLIVFRYLQATERGDLETINDLWAEAAADPELETALHSLNEELARVGARRRRPVQFGVAVVAAAACVAALIWTTAERRGRTAIDAGNTFSQQTAPPAAIHDTPPTSHVALLARAMEGGDMPAFDWPFSQSAAGRRSHAIPSDLLN